MPGDQPNTRRSVQRNQSDVSSVLQDSMRTRNVLTARSQARSCYKAMR